MSLLELAAKAQLLLAAADATEPPPAPLLPNPGPMPLPAKVLSQGSSLIGWTLTGVGLLGIVCLIGAFVMIMTDIGGRGSGSGIGNVGKVVGGLIGAFSAAAIIGGLVLL